MGLFVLFVCFACAQLQGEVDVFKKGEGGFFCIKIPALLAIPNSSMLLAFAEARNDSCSDYTRT